MSQPAGPHNQDEAPAVATHGVSGESAPHPADEFVLRDARPRRRWRKRRWLAGLTGLVLIIACAFAGALVYLDARLDSQPLAIESLAPAIAQSLSTRAGSGYQVTIGNTYLAKEQGRPAITIDGFRLVGANGETILSAPKAIVALDWAALLTGSIKLRRLAVAGLDLHVRVDGNGALSVSAGRTRVNLTRRAPGAAAGGTTLSTDRNPGPPPGAGAQPPSGASADLRADLPADLPAVKDSTAATLASAVARAVDLLFQQAEAQGSAFSAMRHVGITGGRLLFEDASRNRSTTFNGLNVEVVRQGKAVEVTVSANAPAGRWQVKAGVRTDGAHRLNLEIGNLTLDEITLIAGLRDFPADFDMPLNGKMELQIGLGGNISKAEGKFSTGKGYFLMRNRDFEPVFVDRVAGSFRWDAASQAILIDRLDYTAGNTDLVLQGKVIPAGAGGEIWRIAVSTAKAGRLAHQKPGRESVAVGRMQADLTIDARRRLLVVERFALAAPDANLLLAATYDFNAGNRRLQLTAEADAMALDRGLSLWPSFLASPVRGWALQNLSGGRLEELRVKLDFGEQALQALAEKRHLPEGSMDIAYKVSGANLTYLKGVTPVSGLVAEGRTRGPVTVIEVKSGAATVAAKRRLAVLPGTITITDRAPLPAVAAAKIRLAGSVRDVATLLAQPGLAPYAPAGIEMSKTAGKIEADIDLDFRIGKRGTDPKVQTVTRAKLTSVSIADFVGPAALENCSLDLVVRNGQMSAKGTGKLLGTTATIAVTQQGSGPMQGAIGLTLDTAARKKLGWATGDRIAGPIGVKIAGQLGREQGLRGDVTLDLTKASLVDLVPGFDKPAGRAATASFRLAARQNSTTLSNFSFRTQGLSARGTIELGAKGVFQSATLSHLRMSPGDDLRAEVKASSAGTRIALSGGAIDLRPFLSRTGAAPGEADSALQLAVNTKIATGFNGQILGNFKLDMATDRSGISRFNLDTRAGRSPVRGRVLQRGDGGALIEIVSSDAGTVLSFMDVYKRMEGGHMTLRARAAGGSVSGSLDVRNFLLRNEPAMRQLVARGTNEQVRSQIDATAVRFQKLQFVFQRGAGRLSVRDGILSGPEIGLTLDGSIDFAGDRVAMTGTFVPAYGLNNAFARIPLFGPLLGGGKNEGLLGVNFRVSGRASAPVLNINPLSAIAPGFLRKIFGVMPAPAPVPARSQRLPDMPLNLGLQR